MTVAYFDCLGGISGDMAMAALLDAGGDLAVVEGAVEALGLTAEVAVRAEREQRGHAGGTRVHVDLRSTRPRRLPELEETVARADLPPRVRDRSLDALRRLGQAEARLHDRAVEELHLHE